MVASVGLKISTNSPMSGRTHSSVISRWLAGGAVNEFGNPILGLAWTKKFVGAVSAESAAVVAISREWPSGSKFENVKSGSVLGSETRSPKITPSSRLNNGC